MVSNHAPRVYATVTAHVNRDVKPSTLLVARVSGWWRGSQPLQRGPALIMHNTKPGVCCRMPPADTVASSNRMTASSEEEEEEEEGRQGGGSWETEKARSAPKGNKSVTVSGNRRQMDHFFWLLFITFVSVSILKKIIFVWVILLLSCRLPVYEKARVCLRQMSGPGWWRPTNQSAFINS